MTSQNAREIFEAYCDAKKLKRSKPRQAVMDIFIQAQAHLTADELYRLVKKKNPSVGYATVYRTLKLLCASGLCRELPFADGTARFEPLHGRGHHDHLMCTHCGCLVEVCDPDIEHLQEKLIARYGFVSQWHRLELYGICPNCRKKKRVLETMKGKG